MDKKTKKLFLKQLNVEKDELKRIIKTKRINKEKEEYIIYKTTFYGKISNFFFENITLRLTRKYKKFFDNVITSLISSGIPVLSKTYISMMFFTSFLAFFFITLAGLLYNIFNNLNIFLIISRAFLLGFFASLFTFVLFYFYPSMIVKSRKREIKNDLPFVIVHMAAVAGSGAQPISMFNLLLTTGEYKGLESEIKKIINYVNLFGYDLSTALRTVARTTPSDDFRELLNGIISTVESGGDLKLYLKGKADDSFTSYKLERKKYVETLSTYSDVYTGVLIAAPLLFIVTLAIINMLGGQIAGIDVKTLASLGTYGILPLLNIGFILFLNLIQPEA